MGLKREIGNQGEDIASAFLRSKGHKILERNWRSGKDEVDIITLYKGFLVIVEVKTRSNASSMSPEHAVDDRKQKCLMRAAEAYVDEHNIDAEIRFDIVSVITGRVSEEVFHIEDAFYATLE